jgi:CRP-like cAMP-binding protein
LPVSDSQFRRWILIWINFRAFPLDMTHLASQGANPMGSMYASRNGLLASLPAPDLALIGHHLKRVPLNAGNVLQEQDAPVEFVYFPLSGAVSLLAIMSGADAIETAIIGREGAIGVAADLGPWLACARAVVQLSGSAECIPAPVLKAVASESQEISRVMLRYREALCSQVHQKAACNATHSVEQRFARWLLEALDRCDSGEVAVTQEAISMLLGVRRTTVSNAARRLQAEGMIRHHRGRVIVADRARLQELACECYETCRRRMEMMVQGDHEHADFSGELSEHTRFDDDDKSKLGDRV